MHEPIDKYCKKCDKITTHRWQADRRAKEGGSHSVCQVCISNWRRSRYYGIPAEEYDRRVAEQAGLCAICGNPPYGRWGKLCVDHDHATGRVRGLICTTCNQYLARIKDDPTKLVKYLL